MLPEDYNAIDHINACMFFASSNGCLLEHVIMPKDFESTVDKSLSVDKRTSAWAIDSFKRLVIYGVVVTFSEKLTRPTCLMMFDTLIGQELL
jgi:hypothetical protein